LARRKYREPSQIETLRLFENLEKGSEAAFKDLVYKFSFIPQRLARRYSWAGNHHDLQNVGYIALMKSIRNFDPALCNNFVMWSYPQVKTAIGRAKYAEKKWIEQRKKQEPLEDFKDQLKNGQDLEASYISDELKELLTLYLYRLEKTPRAVMIKSYGLYDNDPKTIREVSKELGVSTKRVWKTRQTATKQLRKMFQIHANNSTNEHGITQGI
jgi:RNA polymerase sigma factor (sigma-70 family)